MLSRAAVNWMARFHIFRPTDTEDAGEPWRRMYMEDATTAFATLALLPLE
jgi:hypothetical protein